MDKKLYLPIAAALLLAVSCGKAYEPDLQAEWTLTLESLDTARTQMVIPSSDAGAPVIQQRGKRTVIRYDGVAGRDIDVTFVYKASGNTVEVTPSLVNREEGYVALSLTVPEFRDLGVDVEEMDLLVPYGTGFRYDLTKLKSDKRWKINKEKHYFESDWSYPSMHCDMQWAQFSGGERNLYLASHDPEFRWKVFRFRYYPREKRVAFTQENHFACHPGDSWNGPATTVAWTEGSWKVGSKTYRDWFLSVRPLEPKAEWIRHNSGWLLTILRQQNDEMMWTYPEVGTTLLDETERRGIDIVSLFGWTVGGHDRYYPDYDVSPAMGGEEALRESIRKIHERGKKVTVYFNGQLIDQNGTQFWPDTGRFISTVGRDGQPLFERWWKYANIEPRIHSMACQGTEVWHKRLLNLAMKAHDLGADGLIYDQLATRAPMYCYGEGHGHPVPAVVYDRDRVEILEWVSKKMKAIDPDFLVITEGVEDCELNGVSMFHGCSSTLRNCLEPHYIRQAIDDEYFSNVFPDMFHYTFPEADFTVRTPTPASTRGSLNFGTVFGYKHEIECRYAPDKRYMVEGIIPDRSEYDIVKGRKPDFKTMEDQDPAEAVRYSKAVLDFRRQYTDIFYDGNFIADDGFALESDGKYVIARAFLAGRKMGVVVWNVSDDEAAAFTVTPDKGWKLVETAAPEGTPAEGDIPPQSLRLLVYEK